MAVVADYLVGLVTRVGHLAYLIIFLGATAESAAFVGLLVPGESVVLIAGFLCGQGLLDLDLVLLTVAVGAVLGDNIGYELGRRLGRPWADRHGARFGLTRARMERAEAFFRRHGGNAVFLGRFVSFGRALVPFVAGSAGMARIRFLAVNLLGGTLWSVVIVLLGYYVGRAAERWIGEASAIAGGTLLAAILLVIVWRWLLTRESQIGEWWRRFRDHPRVTATLDRISPATAWLRARLSPGGFIGLELTVGVVVFLTGAWLFGGIAEDVVSGDPLTLTDAHLASWFQLHQNGRATAFFVAVSEIADWPVVSATTLVFVSYLAWKRSWRWMALTLCAVPAGVGVNALLKLAFHRARPPLFALPQILSTYSFPSGHVMTAVAWYGTLALFVASRLRVWRWQVLAFVIAFAVVALVALSRVYLRAHYLSDVLAGAAGGVAWLALCYAAVGTIGGGRFERIERGPPR